ncbi:hypothetical protein IRJ41_025555 [Triplophysa rosa]|uniref:GIY-YIG domain-containing protein n=1 Tax=Triplophysa rosa TaxID=992332 RepID=A0A9W7TJR6_TRIRA|nr:hypothetical protein IRJ41_025555 [Triplophysa rosa]
MLHKASSHPKHLFRGIVKGQLIRYQRICTLNQDETQARMELFRALRERGYSRGMLRRIQREVQVRKPTPRQQLQPRVLPLVIGHSATNQKLASKIRKNFVDSTLRQDVVERSRMVVAFTRGKNLADLLVHSKFTNRKQHKIQGRRALVRSGQTRVHRVEGGSKIRKNGIYLIFCKKCGIKYVGETGGKIRDRLTNHTWNIKTGKGKRTLVIQHFRKHGLKNFGTKVLQTNRDWDLQTRRRRERFWMRRLLTMHPKGLNARY